MGRRENKEEKARAGRFRQVPRAGGDWRATTLPRALRSGLDSGLSRPQLLKQGPHGPHQAASFPGGDIPLWSAHTAGPGAPPEDGEGLPGSLFSCWSHLPAPQRDFNKDTSPQDSGFLSEMEELWHKFLTRPGCPQFSTRSTSMTHYGERAQRGPTWAAPPPPNHSTQPSESGTRVLAHSSLRGWPEGTCAVATAAASEIGSQLRPEWEGGGREGKACISGLPALLLFLWSHSPRFNRAGTGEEKAEGSGSFRKEVHRAKGSSLGTKP